METKVEEKEFDRLFNPNHRNKTELEHIEHTMERMKKRYDIDLTIDQYYDFLELVQKKGKVLYQLNNSCSVTYVKFLKKNVWVIYGKKSSSCISRHRDLPARIKTALSVGKEYKRFPLPDKLKRAGFSEERFYKDTKKIRIDFRKFVKNVLPTVTPKDLFNQPEYAHLDNRFKSIGLKVFFGKVNKYDVHKLAFSLVIDRYFEILENKDYDHIY
jgi:hypothetical protein